MSKLGNFLFTIEEIMKRLFSISLCIAGIIVTYEVVVYFIESLI